MKILLILLGVLVLAFIIIQLFAMNGQRNIETYPYVVNKKYNTFEIRNYEATLFTSVQLSGNKYKDASSKGFSLLAGYIFGGNKQNEKIAMTSPVAMSLEEPAKTMAAISFSGWANDEKIEAYKQKLKSALDTEKIEYTNRFYFLGYNPPYEVFNRKNEIIVELENETYNITK